MNRGTAKLAVTLIFISAGIILSSCTAYTEYEMGLAKMEKRDYRDAIEHFDIAVAKGRGSATLFAQRGLALDLIGEHEKAVEDLSEAIRHDPKLPWTWAHRSDAYRKLGRGEEAIRDANEAIYRDPEEIQFQYRRGMAYVEAGKYHDAIQDFSKVLEKNSDFGPAYYGRGRAYYFLEDYEAAIRDYTRSAKYLPSSATVFNNRGSAFHKLNRPDKAIADYTRAIDRDKKFYVAYYNRGVAQYESGRWDLAIADFNRAIKLKPRLVASRLYLLDIFHKNKNYPKLLAMADEINALKPDIPEVYRKRADALENLNRTREAIADLRLLTELTGGDEDIFHRLARLNLEIGEKDAAMVELTRAIAANNSRAIYRFNRGELYMDRKDYTSAVADFDAAAGLDREIPHLFEKRGIAHFHLGNYERAEADLTIEVRRGGATEALYEPRARSAFALKKYEIVVEDMPRVLAKRTPDPELLKMLGVSYIKTAMPSKATAAFDVVVELRPDDPEAYIDRGVALSLQGFHDMALADLATGIALDTNDPRGYRERGRIFYQMGRYEEALRDLGVAKNLE